MVKYVKKCKMARLIYVNATHISIFISIVFFYTFSFNFNLSTYNKFFWFVFIFVSELHELFYRLFIYFKNKRLYKKEHT